MGRTLQAAPVAVLATTNDTSRGLLGVREIPLRNSDVVAVVDEADYRRVSGRPWKLKYSGRRHYVTACVRVGPGAYDWKYVLLHRLVMGLERGDPLCVDHIDGDALNNRRKNLRVCTIGENTRNRGKTAGRQGYKGVSCDSHGWFTAKVGSGGYVGKFASAVEAAIVYNDVAATKWGEFAKLNSICDESEVRILIERRDELRCLAEEIEQRLENWPCA